MSLQWKITFQQESSLNCAEELPLEEVRRRESQAPAPPTLFSSEFSKAGPATPSWKTYRGPHFLTKSWPSLSPESHGICHNL